MPGAAAFRGIAGNIQKIAFFITLRTCVRRYYSGDKKSALGTFPIRLIALRAYILFEFSISGIATKSTHHFLLFTFHYLPSSKIRFH